MASGEEMLRDIKEGFPLMNFGVENDLEKLMRQAEVFDTPYVKRIDQERLMDACAWTGTAWEFLYLFRNSISSLKPGPNIAFLGLSDYCATYQIHSKLSAPDMHYQKRIELYKANTNPDDYRLAIEAWGKTAWLMRNLLDDKTVDSVVMLTPPKLFSYQNPNNDGKYVGVTRDEYRFLLENAKEVKQSKKVYLVFGAYELINKQGGNEEKETTLRLEQKNGDTSTEVAAQLLELMKKINSLKIHDF